MNPLQIFEKHPTADAYRVGGFYSPYALVSTEKRFSEAELAAEYWQACPNYQSRFPPVAKEWEAAVTFRRFTNSPHFDA